MFGDRKGTTKKLRDKDFAKRSGELSGAIFASKALVLLDNDQEPPRIVQTILWCCSREFLALSVLFDPLKFSETPRFVSSKPKEDKLSREGTNLFCHPPLRVEDLHATGWSPDPKS